MYSLITLLWSFKTWRAMNVKRWLQHRKLWPRDRHHWKDESSLVSRVIPVARVRDITLLYAVSSVLFWDTLWPWTHRVAEGELEVLFFLLIPGHAKLELGTTTTPCLSRLLPCPVLCVFLEWGRSAQGCGIKSQWDLAHKCLIRKFATNYQKWQK